MQSASKKFRVNLKKSVQQQQFRLRLYFLIKNLVNKQTQQFFQQLMIRYCLKGFSTSKKPLYDVIFIGPVASLVGKQFHKATGGKFQSLVINSHQKYLEPCLIPTRSKPLKISDIVYRKMENCDIKIEKVIPEASKIKYADGSEIGYRHLVFTENNEPVYNTIEGLKQALDNPYSMVYSNRPGTDIDELYHVQTGDVVFSIPKGRHTGHDNYLMLHLLSKMQQKKKDNAETRVSFKMTIVNAEGRFFPYHQKLQKFYRDELHRHGVEVIDRVDIRKIDSNSRSIHLGNGKILPYTAFYHYLALKEPKQIEGILSTDLNKQTLRHNKFPNISIFGNAELPTTHSYYATNYQINVVRQNITRALFNDPVKAIYEGDTAIPVWKEYNKCMYFGHTYERMKKYDGVGTKDWVSRVLGADRWYLGQWEVDTYYKGKHYGVPYYFKYPPVKLQKEPRTVAEKYKLDRKSK